MVFVGIRDDYADLLRPVLHQHHKSCAPVLQGARPIVLVCIIVGYLRRGSSSVEMSPMWRLFTSLDITMVTIDLVLTIRIVWTVRRKETVPKFVLATPATGVK